MEAPTKFAIVMDSISEYIPCVRCTGAVESNHDGPSIVELDRGFICDACAERDAPELHFVMLLYLRVTGMCHDELRRIYDAAKGNGAAG